MINAQARPFSLSVLWQWLQAIGFFAAVGLVTWWLGAYDLPLAVLRWALHAVGL